MIYRYFLWSRGSYLNSFTFTYPLKPTPLPYPHLVEADEIRRLSHSFNKLDLNKNGSLSVDEFLSIPELQQNPLVRRVIDILDTDRNGEVDFQGQSYIHQWRQDLIGMLVNVGRGLYGRHKQSDSNNSTPRTLLLSLSV